MKKLRRAGGIAALVAAAAYLTGFVLYFGILDVSDYDGPNGQVQFLADNQQALHFGNIVIYIIFSIALVILALATHECLKARSSVLMPAATVFAMIWAGLVVASGMITNIGMATAISLAATDPDQAATVWLAVSTVQEGLGGGVEVVGGLWVLLMSWVALRYDEFPKALNYLGVIVGVAGSLTVLPGADMLTAVFGLGQIPWFVWLGVVLLRRRSSADPAVTL